MQNEKCVICGKDTGISEDMPVAYRKRYIKGSGQLCRDCYYDLYLKSESEEVKMLEEEEIEKLLYISRES